MLSADGSVGSPHVRVGHCQASIRNPCCFLQQGFSFTWTLNSHKFEAAPGIHALTRHLGILPSSRTLPVSAGRRAGQCRARLVCGARVCVSSALTLSALGRLTKSLISGEPAVSQRQPVASERRPWDIARQALDLVTLRGFRRDARGYGFGTKAYAKIRASLLACSIKRFCVPSVTIVPRPL